MLKAFIESFILGYVIAMPVGPIGMICIKNTLSRGFKSGLATGLGGALADSCYGFMAGGGMAFLSKLLINNTNLIKIFGSAILFYLGINEILHAKSKIADVKIKNSNFIKTIATTYLLTITSPMTILSFVGAFAIIGSNSLGSGTIFFIVFGIFCGSLSWWLTLAISINIIRHKISQNSMAIIKIISGIILCTFAIYAIISVFG